MEPYELFDERKPNEPSGQNLFMAERGGHTIPIVHRIGWIDPSGQ
jgi:hypothetical protein